MAEYISMIKGKQVINYEHIESCRNKALRLFKEELPKEFFTIGIIEDICDDIKEHAYGLELKIGD